MRILGVVVSKTEGIKSFFFFNLNLKVLLYEILESVFEFSVFSLEGK